MSVTKCNDDDIESYVITEIDDCYRYAKIDPNAIDVEESARPSGIMFYIKQIF